jgi:hypothetical protein
VSKDQLGDNEFKELLLACQEIATSYPEGVIYIGGIAVYLHSINNDATKELAEFTHDADFYISLADMGDLRDSEQVTANRRLSKHQLIKRGFEFDIYTERQSALIVPYDQVYAHARSYECLRVASLEHLLVLKLEAYRDRHQSTKGQKDAKDLIRIALIAAGKGRAFRADLCAGYLHSEHLDLLRKIAMGPEFLALARGNAKTAKTMRGQFSSSIEELLG